MSPAAKEVVEASPSLVWCREERLLCAVVARKMTAHDAARSLTPAYVNHMDSGVLKMEQAAIEDIEFYRDLVIAERHHDKDQLAETANNLRRLWDRK